MRTDCKLCHRKEGDERVDQYGDTVPIKINSRGLCTECYACLVPVLYGEPTPEEMEYIHKLVAHNQKHGGFVPRRYQKPKVWRCARCNTVAGQDLSYKKYCFECASIVRSEAALKRRREGEPYRRRSDAGQKHSMDPRLTRQSRGGSKA